MPLTVSQPEVKSATANVAVELTSSTTRTADSVAGLLPIVGGNVNRIAAIAPSLEQRIAQRAASHPNDISDLIRLVAAASPVTTATNPTTASVIDLLTNDYAILLQGVGQSAANVGSSIGGLPAELVTLVKAVVANPSVLPNVISSLLHYTFAMPGTLTPPVPVPVPAAAKAAVAVRQLSILAGIVVPIVNALDEVLPGPLGTVNGTPGLIRTGAQFVYTTIDKALALLPPVYSATPEATLLSSPVSQLTSAFDDFVTALGTSVQGVTNWFGAVPGRLVELTRDLVADPSKFPNAITTIAYSLIGLPSAVMAHLATTRLTPQVQAPVSLLAAAITPILASLERILPSPLGNTSNGIGLVKQFQNAVTTLDDNVFAKLPSRIILSTGGAPRAQAPAAAQTTAVSGMEVAEATGAKKSINADPAARAQRSAAAGQATKASTDNAKPTRKTAASDSHAQRTPHSAASGGTHSRSTAGSKG